MTILGHIKIKVKVLYKNFDIGKKLEKKWSILLFLSVEFDHWNRFLWPKQGFSHSPVEKWKILFGP